MAVREEGKECERESNSQGPADAYGKVIYANLSESKQLI